MKMCKGRGMKRLILGLALLGYFGAAYGADWVKIGTSVHGGEAVWAMRAQGANEVWQKIVHSSPQNHGSGVYNKTITLNRINCSQGSDTIIQGSAYLNDTLVNSDPGPFAPFYGAPGTFEAAIINAYCGTK